MIVWGGIDEGGTVLDTGGRFNPMTNTWSGLPTVGAPSAREYFTAVWAGTEMIVWGGSSPRPSMRFDTGGRFNPATNVWTALPTDDAPSARTNHTAVWTGTEMLVWGGSDSRWTDTGGRFDPSTSVWSYLPTAGAPTARQMHTALWTGSEMLVWGGDDSVGRVSTGGWFDPNTGTWSALPVVGAPPPRQLASAVWTGTEMIIWGGEDSQFNLLNSGARLGP